MSLLAAAAWLAGPAWGLAAKWPAPRAYRARSADGSVVVELKPGALVWAAAPEEEGARLAEAPLDPGDRPPAAAAAPAEPAALRPARAVVFRAEGAKLEKIGEFPLLHPVLPVRALVSPDGAYLVTEGNWFRIGEGKVYSFHRLPRGELVAAYSLDELFSPEVLRVFAGATSRRPWCAGARHRFDGPSSLRIRYYWGETLAFDLPSGRFEASWETPNLDPASLTQEVALAELERVQRDLDLAPGRSPRSFQEVLARGTEPRHLLRSGLLEVLKTRATASSLPALARLVERSRNGQVEYARAYATVAGAEGVPKALSWLEKGGEGLRAAGASALAGCGKGRPEALSALRRAVEKDPASSVRVMAIGAYGDLGDESLLPDALFWFRKHTDPQARASAAHWVFAWGRHGADDQAVEALLDGLAHDPAPAVRARAASYLATASVLKPELRQTLLERSAEDPAIREAVERALPRQSAGP